MSICLSSGVQPNISIDLETYQHMLLTTSKMTIYIWTTLEMYKCLRIFIESMYTQLGGWAVKWVYQRPLLLCWFCSESESIFSGRISHCSWFMSRVNVNRSAELHASFQICCQCVLALWIIQKILVRKMFIEPFKTFDSNVFLVVNWNFKCSEFFILTHLAWGGKIKTNIWYKFI